MSLTYMKLTLVLLYLLKLNSYSQSFDNEFQEGFSQEKKDTKIIEESAPEKYLAVQAGFNLATINGRDSGAANKLKAGLHVSTFALLPFNDIWAFQPELILFSQKGTVNGNAKFRSSYFEIPLLASYAFNEEFRIIGGLQPAFLLSAHVNDGRGDITSDIRKVDVGLALGAYYQFHERLSTSLRIVPGLSRVGESGEENTYNFTLQFSIAYHIISL